jgi:hypothetical protein
VGLYVHSLVHILLHETSYNTCGLAGLLDLLKGLIESAVKGSVESAFSKAIEDFVTNDLNPQLAKIQMDVPLHLKAPYNISEVRFGLTSDPAITTSYLGIDLQGDVVPIANPVTPPLTPPSLPPFNPATGGRYLQLQFSSYTALSAVYTFVQAGVTNWYFPSTQVPLGLNTTAPYALIAPGLPTAYPDCAVSIDFDLSTLPSININTSGVALSAPLLFSVLVAPKSGGSVNAFTLNVVASMDAKLTVGTDSSGAMALMGSLSYLDAELSVYNTSVGTVNAALMQT